MLGPVRGESAAIGEDCCGLIGLGEMVLESHS